MHSRDPPRAVNPVVGTIVLVGIVVILSAAVGAFVLGLGADLSGGARAGVDVTDVSPAPENGTATVTVITLGDADRVVVTATASGGNGLDDGGTDVTELELRLDSTGDEVRVREGAATGGGAETEVDLVAVVHDGPDEALVLDDRVVL